MTTLRLLLIDDNPDDRTLAKRELEREFNSIEATEINSDSKLSKVLEQGNFDLVITDYQLRWSTGLKILERVKEKYPQIPVVMFTGTGNEEVAVEAMKKGLDDYVVKSPKHYLRLAKAVRLTWERTQQQKRLQEIESQYSRLFESVPVGLYRANPPGEVLEANVTLAYILGYSDAQDLLEVNLIQSHVDTENRAEWKKNLNSEELKHIEARLHRRDNKLIWVRHSAKPVYDEEQNLIYYEGAIEDITDYKKAEKERAELLEREQKAREEAEVANRLKDEFLATLSHELRTPLNSILGWIQMMQRGKLSPQRREVAFEIIERNVRTQTQLIEDLLDVSRIIRGKMKLQMRPVNLPRVVRVALDTVLPAAEAKSITIQPPSNTDLEPIPGDAERLQQVIWNLLINAIKFTPNGGTVSVEIVETETDIQVQVSDTGIGLDPDFVPFAFDRFRQKDSSSRRTHGGLGLGLSIVRHLVEMHGGTVSAHSEGKNQGSTFAISLPLPDSNTFEKKSEPSNVAEDVPDLQGLSILVVEDEPDARELYSLILEEAGADVTTVGSVDEALNAREAQYFDILVSDISMPGKNGYDLIEEIRTQESDGDKTPAIALTAHASDEDRQRVLAAGFQVHLSKPLDPDDLLETVASLVSTVTSDPVGAMPVCLPHSDQLS